MFKVKQFISVIKIDNILDSYRDKLEFPINRDWFKKVICKQKERLINNSEVINNTINIIDDIIREAVEIAITVLLEQVSAQLSYKEKSFNMKKKLDSFDVIKFDRIFREEMTAMNVMNHPRLWSVMGVSYGQGMERGLSDLGKSPEQLPWHEFRETKAYQQKLWGTLKHITNGLSDRVRGVVAVGVADGLSPYMIARRLRDIKLGPKKVFVNPKIVDGVQVRKGYSYIISDKRYAEMIARTESARALTEGRVGAYRRGGIKQVQWLSAGDDRVCILEGTAKVLTKKGIKNIKDIKIGESVLTHEDRYRKVLKTWHRKTNEEVMKITLKGKLESSSITVTLNHSFFVLRDNEETWVQAKDLLLTDKIFYFARKCPLCNNLMPIGNKFCSLSCASKVGNQRRWSDPKQHKEQSKRNKKNKSWIKAREGFDKKRLDNPNWWKLICKRMGITKKEHFKNDIDFRNKRVKLNQKTAKYPNHPFNLINKDIKRKTEVLKKAHKTLGKNHLGRTWIEKKVAWWLKKINISFISTKYFKFDKKRRWVDFYLPDYNLIIEVDGEYWHSKKDVILLDKQKDIEAKKYGFNTLRLSGKDIRNNFDKITKQINQAIYNGCFIPIKIKKLKSWKLKKNQPVYNLTVEDDNSYVVNYMVVHNCDLCMDLDGRIFPINAAPMVPLHISCRCDKVSAGLTEPVKVQEVTEGEKIYANSFTKDYTKNSALLKSDLTTFKTDYRALTTIQRKQFLRQTLNQYNSVGIVPKVAHSNLDDIGMMVLQSKKLELLQARQKAFLKLGMGEKKSLLFIGDKKVKVLNNFISSNGKSIINEITRVSKYNTDLGGLTFSAKRSINLFQKGKSLNVIYMPKSKVIFPQFGSEMYYGNIKGHNLIHEIGHTIYNNKNILDLKINGTSLYKIANYTGTKFPTVYASSNPSEAFSEFIASKYSGTYKLDSGTINFLDKLEDKLLLK